MTPAFVFWYLTLVGIFEAYLTLSPDNLNFRSSFDNNIILRSLLYIVHWATVNWVYVQGRFKCICILNKDSLLCAQIKEHKHRNMCCLVSDFSSSVLLLRSQLLLPLSYYSVSVCCPIKSSFVVPLYVMLPLPTTSICVL